jgi:acetyl esterase/lipase
VLEKDIQIPARDGYTNRARIYTPHESSEEGSPLLVMVHGGGYCLGGLELEEMNCRTWVKKFGGAAVNIEHRFVILVRRLKKR